MQRIFAAFALAAVLAAPSPARAGFLSASASCDANGQIVVSWTFYDDPFHPIDNAAWFGYDVFRLGMDECGTFELLNADPVPRPPGTHTLQYVDTPPASGVTYAYRVIPIDQNRQQVFPGYPDCDPPCTGQAWASCPNGSSPATVGTLNDHGWAIFVSPCADGCWPYLYVEGQAAVEALRPYADGIQIVALYGTIGCGSVEGCALQMDRFEPTACGVTPARSGTWGRLKELYR